MSHPRAGGARPALASLAVALLGLAGCGAGPEREGPAPLLGRVSLDGDPASAALAQSAGEQFRQVHPDVDMVADRNGASQGLARACAGETDVVLVVGERPALPPGCGDGGPAVTWVQIASDALVVARGPGLDVPCLSLAQLRSIWSDPSGPRSAPVSRVQPVGPLPGSQTAERFRDALGIPRRAPLRGALSEDDRIVLASIARTGGVGYARYGAVVAGPPGVRPVAVDAGAGCVRPTRAAIQDGRYRPLTARVHLGWTSRAAARREVRAFVTFAVSHHAPIAQAAQLVELSDAQAAVAAALVHPLDDGASADSR